VRDLKDTLVGFLGSFVFMFTFDRWPLMAISMIGFHIGVTTMRASRIGSTVAPEDGGKP
jgi:hypothetical protein